MLDLVKISCSDVSYTTPLYTGRAKLLTLNAPIPQNGNSGRIVFSVFYHFVKLAFKGLIPLSNTVKKSRSKII